MLQVSCSFWWTVQLGAYFPDGQEKVMVIPTIPTTDVITGLAQTLDEQISRQHLRIDSIFPESTLKNGMFFPDRLAKKNKIFQT